MKPCDPLLLTRPETFAALNHARAFVKRELANGRACGLCKHRSQANYWGRHLCALNPDRTFPLCMKDGQAPSFELDESTVEGKVHG